MRHARLAIPILCLTFGLQGCVAAAIPLISVGMAAVSGFTTFKMIQSSTGGSVKVGFNPETEAVDTAALQSLTALGIWPEGEAEVFMAEHFETLAVFPSVITPGRVAQVLDADNAPRNLTLLTQSERLALFRSICDETGADAVIASVQTGDTMNMKMFSFARDNVTSTADVFVYARSADRIVFRTEMELVIGMGSTTPSTTELARIWGEAIVEKIRDERNGTES